MPLTSSAPGTAETHDSRAFQNRRRVRPKDGLDAKFVKAAAFYELAVYCLSVVFAEVPGV